MSGYLLDCFTQSKLQKEHPHLLRSKKWESLCGKGKRFRAGWETIFNATMAYRIVSELEGEEAVAACRDLQDLVIKEFIEVFTKSEYEGLCKWCHFIATQALDAATETGHQADLLQVVETLENIIAEVS